MRKVIVVNNRAYDAGTGQAIGYRPGEKRGETPSIDTSTGQVVSVGKNLALTREQWKQVQQLQKQPRSISRADIQQIARSQAIKSLSQRATEQFLKRASPEEKKALLRGSDIQKIQIGSKGTIAVRTKSVDGSESVSFKQKQPQKKVEGIIAEKIETKKPSYFSLEFHKQKIKAIPSEIKRAGGYAPFVQDIIVSGTQRVAEKIDPYVDFRLSLKGLSILPSSHLLSRSASLHNQRPIKNITKQTITANTSLKDTIKKQKIENFKNVFFGKKIPKDYVGMGLNIATYAAPYRFDLDVLSYTERIGRKEYSSIKKQGIKSIPKTAYQFAKENKWETAFIGTWAGLKALKPVTKALAKATTKVKEVKTLALGRQIPFSKTIKTGAGDIKVLANEIQGAKKYQLLAGSEVQVQKGIIKKTIQTYYPITIGEAVIKKTGEADVFFSKGRYVSQLATKDKSAKELLSLSEVKGVSRAIDDKTFFTFGAGKTIQGKDINKLTKSQLLEFVEQGKVIKSKEAKSSFFGFGELSKQIKQQADKTLVFGFGVIKEKAKPYVSKTIALFKSGLEEPASDIFIPPQTQVGKSAKPIFSTLEKQNVELVKKAIQKEAKETKLIIKPLIVKKTKQPTASMWEGTGEYEREPTSMVMKAPKQVLDLKPIGLNVGLIKSQLSGRKEVLKQIEKQKQEQKKKEKQLEKLRFREAVRQRRMQGSLLKLRKQQAQKQKQKQVSVLEFEKTPSRTQALKQQSILEPFPLSLKQPTPKLSKEIQKKILKSPAFQLWFKRYGKWMKEGKPTLRQKAIKKGEQLAISTLGASFKITETKKKIAGKTKQYEPSADVFRKFRLLKGKQIPLQDEWIQLASKRLSTGSEIKEIQQARRNAFFGFSKKSKSKFGGFFL